MKKKLWAQLLVILFCVVGMGSCKDNEVNLSERLMGYYEGQGLPGLLGIGLTFNFEQKSKELFSLELKQFRYKREAFPDRGFVDSFLDYKFPNCKFVFVDTTGAKPDAENTGLIFKKPAFAKVVDNETNRELGTLSEYESLSQGKTIVFVPDFYVRDTVRVFGFAFKLRWP